MLASIGKLVDRPGADAGGVGADSATIMRKGFGEWGATFQFDLADAVPPGYYSFHARYMCGGEASQTQQTFVVQAGPDDQTLGQRGAFHTNNKTPFKQQWIAGQGTVSIFPGDKVLRITNTGRAHDAKVFSGFVLGLETPIPSWLTAQRALLRSQFLAVGKQVAEPERWLYLVDGDGAGDDVLFPGLAQDSVRSLYDTTHVEYLLGAKADELAAALNLTARPSAIVVNADQRVVGVLSEPQSVEQVARFLAEPRSVGAIPSYADPKLPEPAALVNGSPARWLVATGWPGRCGVGDWGLDAEALQRPNPGDLFAYGFYTAGNRSGRWQERPVGANGVCRIVDKLTDSYAWGKSTSYAVTYLEVARPVKAVLHFQHSGIQSAVYLDGVERPLLADKSPPLTLARHAPKTRPDENNQEKAVQRPGQEIHDDVTVPQAAQRPLAATLELAEGWHCLILKLVHAQGKDETVLFTSRLTGTEGTPLDCLRTRTSDPTAPLGVAQAAAGLWPSLTLEGVPGNLPRPGEPLTLVADMRVAGSAVRKQPFLAKWLPTIFLPITATLRVTMTDYDGKRLGVYETEGAFPDVVKLDLGPAPGPGFYSLIPELYAADGRLIHRFHPDGFSVVRGNAAQKQRRDKKELWLSYYYPFNNWEHDAAWLERTGLFQSMGSTPGVPKDAEAKWQDAQKRGIVLWGDFAGDSHWMNNAEPEAQRIVDVVPKYTRFFKGVKKSMAGLCIRTGGPRRSPSSGCSVRSGSPRRCGRRVRMRSSSAAACIAPASSDRRPRAPCRRAIGFATASSSAGRTTSTLGTCMPIRKSHRGWKPLPWPTAATRPMRACSRSSMNWARPIPSRSSSVKPVPWRGTGLPACAGKRLRWPR